MEYATRHMMNHLIEGNSRFENVAYFKVPNARYSVERCVLPGIPIVPGAIHAEYTGRVKARILYDRVKVRII